MTNKKKFVVRTKNGFKVVYVDRAVEVVCNEPMPGWISNIIEKLNACLQLDEGWDGPGSFPLPLEPINKALEIIAIAIFFHLPEPTLIAIPQGGIHLNWQDASVSLELEVKQDGKIRALYEVFSQYYTKGIQSETELAELFCLFVKKGK